MVSYSLAHFEADFVEGCLPITPLPFQMFLDSWSFFFCVCVVASRVDEIRRVERRQQFLQPAFPIHKMQICFLVRSGGLVALQSFRRRIVPDPAPRHHSFSSKRDVPFTLRPCDWGLSGSPARPETGRAPGHQLFQDGAVADCGTRGVDHQRRWRYRIARGAASGKRPVRGKSDGTRFNSASTTEVTSSGV